MAKNAVGRPSHVPDAKSRKYVEEMSAVGITQENIAKVIGISVDTLATHYRDELDNAAARANAAVGRSLWLQAVGGPKRDWRKAVPAAGIWSAMMIALNIYVFLNAGRAKRRLCPERELRTFLRPLGRPDARAESVQVVSRAGSSAGSYPQALK
jgi:hypothetical protein